VQADAEREAVVDRLRVVGGGRDQQADVALLGDALTRKGVGAREVGARLDERAAEVELAVSQEGDAGRVVEDGGAVGRLCGVGAREAHSARTLLEDRKARGVAADGAREHEGGGGSPPEGSAGHR
jgi:hypothetical protein